MLFPCRKGTIEINQPILEGRFSGPSMTSVASLNFVLGSSGLLPSYITAQGSPNQILKMAEHCVLHAFLVGATSCEKSWNNKSKNKQHV